MENPIVDFLENSLRKSGNSLVRKVSIATFKARMVVGAAVISFFFFPFFIWLILVGLVVYFVFFRSKGEQQVQEDLDILGSARWANLNDLMIGEGSSNEKKPLLLGLLNGETTNAPVVLGKVVFPPSGKNKPPTEEFVALNGEGHILTIAQTGAGKGVNVVIPNVLLYDHSVVVLDPKGENFIKTHYYRQNEKQQDICLLDPFGHIGKEVKGIISKISNSGNYSDALQYFEDLHIKVTNYGQYLKGFNPMQVIEDLLEMKDYDQIRDEANVIADMLVVKSPNDKDPHWNEKAKSFIREMILFVALSDTCTKDRAQYPLNLVTVKRMVDYVFSTPQNIAAFVEICRKNPFLESVSSTISLIAEGERSSVLSTIQRHLDFLNSKSVQDSITRNDFQLENIRKIPSTIYLVIPSDKIESYNRLARLWVASIKTSLERINDGYRKERPVLFMLDEVAQLGRMELLKSAISLSRSYGLKIWMIFQDMAQIKASYPDDWGTFVSNTKGQQYFGVSQTDIETCELISKAAGQTTVEFVTQSLSRGTSKGSSSNYGYSSGGGEGGGSSNSGGGHNRGSSESLSFNQNIQARPLVNPDEVPKITQNNIIIFGICKYPIVAEKMPYYEMSLNYNRYPFRLENSTMQYLEI